MLLLELLKNDLLLDAETSLRQANVDNVIGCCENYLVLLEKYRAELYKFQGSAEINLRHTSPLNRELIEQSRKLIRSAIESTVSGATQTESLLKSLTYISGYEAVKTFNQLEYRGSAEWELRANEVRLINDDNDERLTVQEAVEVAGLLRRTAYVAYKTTFYE